MPLSSELRATVIELMSGINVDSNRRTIQLYTACLSGRTDLVKELIKQEVNINVTNGEGETPLHLACCKGYTKIVRLLIQHKAKLDVTNHKGELALHCAYVNHHTEIVELLINKSAVTSKNKRILLGLSVFENRTETVELLIKHDREIDPANKNGFMTKIANLLVAKAASIDEAGFHGEAPLLYVACSKDHTAMANLLIDNGANVNQTTTYSGRTALYAASKKGNSKLVRKLIEHKADVNKANSRGVTSLYRACSEGHTKTANLLIDNGANVNLASTSGRTAFYHASKEGNFEIVEKLIKKKADLNQASASGNTPLCCAHFKGHTGIVELIMYSILLENIEGEPPDSIRKKAELLTVWTQLQEVVIKFSSEIKFILRALPKKKIVILDKFITKKNLNFLKKQKFSNYLEKKLEEISSFKEERGKAVGSIVANLSSQRSALSLPSNQNRNPGVYLLNEDVFRIILDYLGVEELKALNAAMDSNEAVSNNPSSFFSNPVENSIESRYAHEKFRPS